MSRVACLYRKDKRNGEGPLTKRKVHTKSSVSRKATQHPSHDTASGTCIRTRADTRAVLPWASHGHSALALRDGVDALQCCVDNYVLLRIIYHFQITKVWSKGSVIAGTSPQHAKKVLIDGHAKPVSLTKKPTMAVKHNDRRKTKERAEVLPTKAVGPRPERFRPPEIVIEAGAFTRPGTIGDYGWQLQPEQYHEYGRALHVYNENMQQQNNKDSTLAGGGNAIARPFRQYGRSIGMPT